MQRLYTKADIIQIINQKRNEILAEDYDYYTEEGWIEFTDGNILDCMHSIYINESPSGENEHKLYDAGFYNGLQKAFYLINNLQDDIDKSN